MPGRRCSAALPRCAASDGERRHRNEMTEQQADRPTANASANRGPDRRATRRRGRRALDASHQQRQVGEACHREDSPRRPPRPGRAGAARARPPHQRGRGRGSTTNAAATLAAPNSSAEIRGDDEAVARTGDQPGQLRRHAERRGRPEQQAASDADPDAGEPRDRHRPRVASRRREHEAIDAGVEVAERRSAPQVEARDGARVPGLTSCAPGEGSRGSEGPRGYGVQSSVTPIVRRRTAASSRSRSAARRTAAARDRRCDTARSPAGGHRPGR